MYLRRHSVAVVWTAADSGAMGFFDAPPAAEPEPPAQHQPWEPPEAELPGIVPIHTLTVGRTDRIAVAVTGLSAFAEGFEVFVTARVRPAGMAGDREAMPDRGAARRSFRFGLLLSDGSKVIGEHGGRGPAHDPEPPGPVLRAFMSGAGPRSHFSRWWAWPLPPAGPLEFVCEWPAFGVAETRAVIDAQLILDAAGRSTRLWPENEG
jgi:hypothetical protein